MVGFKGVMIMQGTDFEDDVVEITKIFSIKTQVGKEQSAADLINSRADKSKIIIPSILAKSRVAIILIDF